MFTLEENQTAESHHTAAHTRDLLPGPWRIQDDTIVNSNHTIKQPINEGRSGQEDFDWTLPPGEDNGVRLPRRESHADMSEDCEAHPKRCTLTDNSGLTHG